MNARIAIICCLVLATMNLYAQAPSDRRQYCSTCILPTANHQNQASMDSTLRSFYQKWTGKYIKPFQQTDQRYVKEYDNEHKNTECVSESQGFGMVITALMEKNGPSTQPLYDSLYRFYKAHPSRKTANDGRIAHLMTEGIAASGRHTDKTAATDGDIDIAYSLALAASLWGNDGPIKYKDLAISLINSIMDYEINHCTWTIYLDDEEYCTDLKHHSDKSFGTRTSDFIPAEFRIFRKLSGNPNWDKVIAKEYALFTQVQAQGGGVIPDYIINIDTDPVPPDGYYQERKTDGEYSVNASRVPWRLATDYLLTGDTNIVAKNLLDKLNKVIYNASHGKPDSLFSGYYLSGIAHSKDNELNFTSPFAVSAMSSATYQAWLDNLWDYVTYPPKDFVHAHRNQVDYFGETIRMLNLFILTGNYWQPEVR
jgi:endo-1,4-beta-D-glucanase Y